MHKINYTANCIHSHNCMLELGDVEKTLKADCKLSLFIQLLYYLYNMKNIKTVTRAI